MERTNTLSRSWLWLFGLAAMVIIIGGLKAISPIITPSCWRLFLPLFVYRH